MSKKALKRHLKPIAPENELLNHISADIPLAEIASAETQLIIDEMLAIANGEQGHKNKRTMVGLAAPQLGVNRRIIIVDVTSTGMGEKPDLHVYINPIITFRSAEAEDGREGCFSTGNICGIVSRPNKVTLEAFDQNGNHIREDHIGFAARIIQHEVDHLDGIRFPDKITDDTKLHWVEPDRFGEYRVHWQDWDILCDRAVWKAMKAGSKSQ